MNKKILVVIDMQNDFIDGALGTAEALAILPRVEKKLAAFDGEIIFTRDTHEPDYLETQEGRNLPVPHCIRNSRGWQIHDSLKRYISPDTRIFDKPTFGSVALGEYLSSQKDISDITCIGLCTDICVISNAMLIKAYLPEIPVIVDSSCCAGVTPESHDNALAAMKLCQIQVVS